MHLPWSKSWNNTDKHMLLKVYIDNLEEGSHETRESHDRGIARDILRRDLSVTTLLPNCYQNLLAVLWLFSVFAQALCDSFTLALIVRAMNFVFHRLVRCRPWSLLVTSSYRVYPIWEQPESRYRLLCMRMQTLYELNFHFDALICLIGIEESILIKDAKIRSISSTYSKIPHFGSRFLCPEVSTTC